MVAFGWMVLAAGLQGAVGAPTRAAVSEADAAFQAGYAAMQRQDLRGAEREFGRVVRLLPQVGAGHGALGAVMLQEGDTAGAVRELETATRLGSKDEATILNLAEAESRAGRAAQAVKLFRGIRVEALTPELARAYAVSLESEGDKAEAVKVLRGAVARAPDDAGGHDALGTVLAQTGENGAAEAEFRRAVELDARDASAQEHLGVVLLLEERAEEALTPLHAAAALQPSDVGTIVELGRAQSAVHQDEAALATLQRAQALAPGNVEATYALALALQTRGEVKESLPMFAEVAKAQPANAGVLTNYALDLVQTGDAASAVPIYQKALALDPANAVLREDLGVAYLQQSDLDHAVEQFQGALALPGLSAAMEAALHYDLGLAMKLKDRLPEAIREFEAAEAADGTLPDPPYTLGVLYMQQGEFTRAASSLERSVSMRPDNGEAWALLGSVDRELQEPEKAEAALRKAIVLEPNQPSPHITLAAVLMQQGARDEAAAERKVAAELSRVAVSQQRAEFSRRSGASLLREGKAAEAAVQLRAATQADPQDEASHRLLAEALERGGDAAGAALERQRAAELEHKAAAR